MSNFAKKLNIEFKHKEKIFSFSYFKEPSSCNTFENQNELGKSKFFYFIKKQKNNTQQPLCITVAEQRSEYSNRLN
jgi:hypothetical protein